MDNADKYALWVELVEDDEAVKAFINAGKRLHSLVRLHDVGGFDQPWESLDDFQRKVIGETAIKIGSWFHANIKAEEEAALPPPPDKKQMIDEYVSIMQKLVGSIDGAEKPLVADIGAAGK